MKRRERFDDSPYIFRRFRKKKIDVLRHIGTAVKDRGPAPDNDELNFGLAKGRHDAREIHKGFRRTAPRNCSAATQAFIICSTRSAGVNRRFSMSKVKSTPYSRAAAILEPGRGFRKSDSTLANFSGE